MGDNWCTIESDPGVFTELMTEGFGVPGVQMEELWSLDMAVEEKNAPMYGLIFLFKYTGEKDERPTEEAADLPDLFFANQVITNACATQAILAVLLNSPEVDLGGTLGEFKAFTREFPPDLKGLAISNSDSIRTAHNGFARQEPFISEEARTATKDDDVFHFIAYVPHGGRVYELDGLKKGPILVGECEEDWLSVARPAIQQRINQYASSEIQFNLMAIVKNRKEGYQAEMAVQEARKTVVDAKINGQEAPMDVDGTDGFVVAADVPGAEAQRADVMAKIAELQVNIRTEEDKFAAWKQENMRRKHNYIPFVMALMKALAEKGKLAPMVDKANAKAAEAGAAAAKA
mmetsp:Transcript_98284/g.281216  ORF Transcript_98284/g.281216 Transcript_98284/m.281216 type:complete len:346 (-) Transcript_98284:97-1134(-)